MTTSRFHVVSSDSDNELDEIRKNRLKNGFELAGTKADFQSLLKSYRNSDVSRQTMDLVGHSEGVEAYLQLGDWALDDVSTVFLQDHKQFFLDLDVKDLRLVGCHTAASQKGWKAIQHIANALGNEIIVWGTKAAVYASNFTTAGYDDSSIVASDDEHYTPSDTYRLPAQAVVVETVIDFDAQTTISSPISPFLSPLIIVPSILGRALFKAIVSPVGYSLPGLLTKPNVTVMARVGARFARIDILLASQYMRVFTPAFPHGLVYEIVPTVARTGLRSYLAL